MSDADVVVVLELLREIRASQLRMEEALATVVGEVSPLVERVQSDGIMALMSGGKSPLSSLFGR